MLIKIVPNDGLVVVDGEPRLIDMGGVDSTLHALIFDTLKSKGRAWHTDAQGDCWQADVVDMTPFQSLLDRWAAAVPPPPPPPIDLSNIDNIDKALKALALCIGQVGGLTVPQMKALFKQKFDSVA